jgi:hypothetical protein
MPSSSVIRIPSGSEEELIAPPASPVATSAASGTDIGEPPSPTLSSSPHPTVDATNADNVISDEEMRVNRVARTDMCGVPRVVEPQARGH